VCLLYILDGRAIIIAAHATSQYWGLTRSVAFDEKVKLPLIHWVTLHNIHLSRLGWNLLRHKTFEDVKTGGTRGDEVLSAGQW
jgi:hypothetical protein